MLDKHFKNYKDWLPDKPLILAVSGGLDSMVLWHLFKHYNIPHVVTTIHHHRRPEADSEFAYIEAQCKQDSIPFFGYHLSFEATRNFQAVARQKRRDIYAQLCEAHQGCIVLAHHHDDQIETLLMRILGRGYWSTYNGMKFYAEQNNVSLLRPLLSFSKNTLRAYADTHNLTYFEDSSNQNLHYKRNRIRHRILPALYAYTDIAPKHLEQFQNLIQRFDTLLHNTINTSQDSLEIADWLRYPEHLKRWLLRSWLHHRIPHHAWSEGWLKSLGSTLETSQKSWEKHVRHTQYLTHAYGSLSLIDKSPTTTLPITLKGFGWHKIAAQRSWFVSEEKNEQIQGKTLELWYNKSIFPITLRHRKAGDVVRMKYGHKKIKDLLIDRKLPQHQRDQLIILEHDDTVLGIWDLKLVAWETPSENKVYITEVYHD